VKPHTGPERRAAGRSERPPAAERRAQPCALVVFGASGDLTRRKLIPALYSLECDGLLAPGFALVGYARQARHHEEFRREMMDAVARHCRRTGDAASRDSFAARLWYCTADYDDPKGYARLAELLADLDRSHGTGGNRLFYLATPPSVVPLVITRLGSAGLVSPQAAGSGWSRIVVEKPFGRDLDSAMALNRQLTRVFHEEQVYRIDHYLGKETVQNILVFRLANGIFEPLWNHHHVDHVQITVAESLGVEGRGRSFEEAGILRDMVQNHLLQLLTLVAMEPPAAFEADAVRDEKVKVLKALRPLADEDVDRLVVRGQYGPGRVDDHAAPGYREEPGVAPDSTVETFVALAAFIDNWRWAGVPFLLRAGKRLPKRATEIAIHFKQAPYALFRSVGCETLEPNVLTLRIQPDEGISLGFGSKAPGQAIRIDRVQMDFRYAAAFGAAPPEAYERLLLDSIAGDSTLFARGDEVRCAWAFVTSILEAWARRPPPDFPSYAAGSWGPAEADALIRRLGDRVWRAP
jgi:glucose-6-phosphate 1-dehydrogenase